MTGLSRRSGADEGATLITALIFTMVVAMVVAVVLAFADTSVRTTLALRDQNAQTAGADGAAQVAINQLRLGSYDGSSGQCFSDGVSTSDTLTLPNFYQPPFGAPDSAAVTCELDPTTTVAIGAGIGPVNRPRNAVLTLGSAASRTAYM